MKIQIENPCAEDWSKMKIGLISRHCKSCEKAVMDFTKMDRAEIITYLLSNREVEVCGRMTHNQFDFHHDDIPLLEVALKQKGGNTSFLILSLVCLSLVACTEENKTIKTQQNPAKTEISALPKEGSDTVSKPTIPETKEISSSPNPKFKVLPEPVYMGEPCIIEPPGYSGGITIRDTVPEFLEEEILTFAEKMPEFKGGVGELFNFIKNTLIYPQMEKENGIEGTVYLQFVVNPEGKISAIKILRGVKGAVSLDREAIRIVKAMPDWLPGENKGKKVSVYTTIPVKFRLD
jgi:TonB family protein